MATNYDIYFQTIPADQYTGFRFISFGQKRTLGVRGIQKLLNIYTKYLLTPVGTDPTDLTIGTDVPNLIGSNTSIDDARDVLLLGIDKTNKAIQAFQTGRDIPDDERFSSGTVTNFISIPAAPGFSAQIHIQNIANQELMFLIPTLTVRT